MTMKKLALLLFALTLFVVQPAFSQAKAHKVLFALTSPDEADWNLMLGNIRNLMKGVAPDPIDIEVVAFGPGVVFLKNDSSAAEEIKAMQSPHLRFVACQNAMRRQKLEMKDLVPGVESVPAGIVEVVKKQEEGWTYIKAGR